MTGNVASFAWAVFVAIAWQVSSAAHVNTRVSSRASVVALRGQRSSGALTLFAGGEHNLSSIGSQVNESVAAENEVDDPVKEEKKEVSVWTPKYKHLGGHKGERHPFECDMQIIAHNEMSKDEKCPPACPFLVQDKVDATYCSFRCVVPEECLKWNPLAPIADEDRGICRSPQVYACKEPKMNGKDECEVCNDYYFLFMGECWYMYMWVGHLVGLLVIALLAGVVLYVVDFATRPVSNRSGLDDALRFRSRMKLLQPVEDGAKPKPWPILTNLHTTLVAGPGLTLHFNFQVMVIIFAGLVALIWMCFGYLVDSDLFRIGTRKFGTPYQNCVLVQWGFFEQQSLMWTKVTFLIIVYVGSTVFTLAYSIRQLRTYQRIMWKNKTMQDFAIHVTGLPIFRGDQKAEDEVKGFLEGVVGKGLVLGVSIAWNFIEKKNEVEWVLDDDLERRDEVYAEAADLPVEGRGSNDSSARSSARRSVPEVVQENPAWCPSWYRNPLTIHRPKLFEFERRLLMPKDDPHGLTEEDSIRKMLEGLESTSEAFVVFATEEDRDHAKKQCEGAGLKVNGNDCNVSDVRCEPATVSWENIGNSTFSDKVLKICKGFGGILLALIVWSIVFYLPYAFAILNFNYENGAEPGAIYSLSFTVVVIAGNAMMYEVCARISDSVGFSFRDQREACYMILYCIACLCNVLLDFVTTYYMAEQIMIALGFRTVDGRRLEEVDTFTERFESYAMQRMLAENLYDYAVSTFSVPFVIEPIITIVAPLIFGKWLIGSHPEFPSRVAQELAAAPQMELGRYADILLNLLLCLLIFFFPGGFTHRLFLGLMFAHVWIYVMDHCRTLKSMRRCNFSSMDIDWWCQMMLAPCVATILSCLAFKGNCQGFGYCLKTYSLFALCLIAFVFHFCVHLALLIHYVPRWGLKEEDMMGEKPTDTFRDVNKKNPCSWFSSNPVHCLRSKYIFKHQTPCVYCQVGREHLLEVNEDIGCHFKCEMMEPETFDLKEIASQFKKEAVSLASSAGTPTSAQLQK